MSVWGKSSISNWNTVTRLYNRSVSLLTSSFLQNNTDQFFMSMQDIYSFFVLVKLFKCIYYQNCHKYFNTKLSYLIPIHHHSTRFNVILKFNVPMYTKSLPQKFFFYHAINLWNNLPINIRNLNQLKSFKLKLKAFFSEV